jgi:hypothetical protein
VGTRLAFEFRSGSLERVDVPSADCDPTTPVNELPRKQQPESARSASHQCNLAYEIFSSASLLPQEKAATNG